MGRDHAALATAALLVASLALTGVVVGDETLLAIDADTPLTSDDAIQEFRDTGSTAANTSQVDMTVHVSESDEQLGIDGYYTDFNRLFACFEYRESLDRRLRVYLPREMVRPRPGQTDALTSDHTVSFEPADGGEYLAVTLEFEGADRACVAWTKEAGLYFDAKRDMRTFVNNTTGISLPSIGTTQAWDRLSPEAFGEDQTATLPAANSTPSVQYDTAPEAQSATWIDVPECSDPADQEVCWYTEDPANESRQMVLLNSQGDPPPIRYNYGGGMASELKSAVRDLDRIADEFLEDVGNWFGGGAS